MLKAVVLFAFLSLAGYARAETTVLFLGDSLTDGYGVRREQAYPALLEQRWMKSGRKIKVINGAESGSLASALPERIDFYSKRFKPNLIVIATGGNDARQLTPVDKIEDSLRKGVSRAKATQAKVALVAMRIFPNLGKEYVTKFSAIYPRVAKSEGVTLIPFLLDKVAGDRELNQPDGFHPNAAGHAKIAETLAPELEKLL